MKCNHPAECAFRRNGECSILSDTVFKRLCPFYREKGSAADQSNAEPHNI